MKYNEFFKPTLRLHYPPAVSLFWRCQNPLSLAICFINSENLQLIWTEHSELWKNFLLYGKDHVHSGSVLRQHGATLLIPTNKQPIWIPRIPCHCLDSRLSIYFVSFLLLKKSPGQLVPLLIEITNTSFREGIFPYTYGYVVFQPAPNKPTLDTTVVGKYHLG